MKVFASIRGCKRPGLGALGAAAVLLAWPSAAQARGGLTAEAVRIADHPAFVRVVVDFRGGRLEPGEIVATDPSPFADGVVRLPVERRGIRTRVRRAAAEGVRARLRRSGDRLVIRLAGARHRFKYAGYSALRRPERLAIDLYKSAPPGAGAQIRHAPGGCLTLESFAVGARSVTASGRERDLFEHGLVVRLRGPHGHVLRQRPVIAANGRWTARLRFTPSRRRAATLEAVAESAKDGTLECVVQARVVLPGR
jgi:hypothetical protein